jgi:transposase
LERCGLKSNLKVVWMVRAEVLNGAERRRRWRFEDKARIVGESFALGATVSGVAQRNGVCKSLVFSWRQQAKAGQLGGASIAPLLIPVELTPPVAEPPQGDLAAPAADPPKHSRRAAGLIEIDLGFGRKLHVDRDVDADALRRVLDVLADRPLAAR